MKGARGQAAVLLCYLSLAAVFLLYWPDVELVLDDWWLFQKISQADTHGAAGQRALAASMAQNTLWGSFRTNGLSFLAVYGLSRLAGPRPAPYFALGILCHALIAYLLYRTLGRLGVGGRVAFLAGALFVVLPTAHQPLFWFPSCAHYVLSALWLMVYLHAVAGTVTAGGLSAGAAATQLVALGLALFSGDQVFGLLAVGAIWMAVCWRSRAALASAGLAWASIAALLGLYIRFVNRAPLGGSLHAKFDFSAARLMENLKAIATAYEKLAGFGEGYYRVAGIGWGAAIAVAAGLVVFWRLRTAGESPGIPHGRMVLFGAGLWVAAYAPVLFLQWRELRYDYLPSLGLAVGFAGVIGMLLERRAWWMATAGAVLAAYGAATVIADIEQCWKPQSRSLRAIRQELNRLRDVRYHDIVAVSGTADYVGTARHFAMSLAYSSTPFVETVTGVWGLVVGRDIAYDTGRMGLLHSDFFLELKPEDLRRVHVVVCDDRPQCGTRTIMAREVEPGRYELYPLKNYAGAGTQGRLYSREELTPLEKDVYFAKKHH